MHLNSKLSIAGIIIAIAIVILLFIFNPRVGDTPVAASVSSVPATELVPITSEPAIPIVQEGIIPEDILLRALQMSDNPGPYTAPIKGPPTAIYVQLMSRSDAELIFSDGVSIIQPGVDMDAPIWVIILEGEGNQYEFNGEPRIPFVQRLIMLDPATPYWRQMTERPAGREFDLQGFTRVAIPEGYIPVLAKEEPATATPPNLDPVPTLPTNLGPPQLAYPAP
jgi:hypothetical protein